MGIEDPDADVTEQLLSAADDAEDDAADDEAPAAGREDLPPEADPADVAEQRIAVPGEDDYER
jgi:hypothetical protein